MVYDIMLLYNTEVIPLLYKVPETGFMLMDYNVKGFVYVI